MRMAGHVRLVLDTNIWLDWLVFDDASAAPLRAAETDSGILQPAELEPDVRFWMRVYSEVSTNEGYIHDQRRLSVVYQTLHFAPDLPPREREAQVEAARTVPAA